MRMLMSLLTRITARCGCCFCRPMTTPRIALSALPSSRCCGSSCLMKLVCKYRRPVQFLCAADSSAMPSSILCGASLTISSRKRLAWRALRATSVMPFFLLSSSSSTNIGRQMSCSSKRNRLVGSCSNTLVSSTNNLVSVFFAVLTGFLLGDGGMRFL